MEPFTVYGKGNTYSLPLSIDQGDHFDNQDALGLRFSLILIENGSGIATINQLDVPYIAPCIFCINEKEHIVITEMNHSKIKAVFFHPSVLNSFFDFQTIYNLPHDAPVTVMQDRELFRFFIERGGEYMCKSNLGPLSAKKISTLIEQLDLQTSGQHTINWPCRSRSYIMEMLFLLDHVFHTENYKQEVYVTSIDEDFYPVLLYIYSNYDKKITVEDITTQFHISKSTFAKRFKDNLGESFLEHLNKMRITMAATMLRDTQLPVNEIMFRVGFSDNVHFLRTFKRYVMESPSVYREKYNWM